MGIIYLLHFTTPLKHARHYIGYVDEDLPRRLAQHQAGHGSKLVQAVNAAGIPWFVSRTWKGTRSMERRLKKGKNAPKLCPTCNGLKAFDRESGRARNPLSV